MKRIIIDVFGRVQGVFFRHNTQKVAQKLGLGGYVKNIFDGSVHIEAEGSQEKLEQLLEFAKKGPKFAYVERIEYKYENATSEFINFKCKF